MLTAWLLRRRVGYLGAIIGCAFMASLVWTVGSQVIVDLTPMQMDPLPFVLLLVAAWSVADGDDAALLVLAGVGNYLVLDHLKFTIAAPGLGLFALVAYALHLRSARRADPDRWPARRRRAASWFGGALAFTAVVWLPPLYQEVAYSPGNLSNLLRASLSPVSFSGHAAVTPTFDAALDAVVATVAVPRLWLRPTFLKPTFDTGGAGTAALWALLWSVALASAFMACAVAARRRRDHTIILGMLTAAVGVVVAVATAWRDPDSFGLRAPYLHFLWPLSMFVWLVLTLGIVRSWSVIRSWARGRGTALVGMAAVVLFGLLNVPIADMGSGTQPWTIPEARALAPGVKAAVKGQGPILIREVPGDAWWLLPSVILDMEAAHVEFKVSDTYDVLSFGAHRAFTPAAPNAKSVLLVTSASKAPAGYRLIARADPKPSLSAADYQAYSRLISTWAAATPSLELNPKVAMAPAVAAQFNAALGRIVAEDKAAGVALGDDTRFVTLLTSYADKQHHLAMDVTGIPPEHVVSWANDRLALLHRRLNVYLAPISAYLHPH